jgi:hypothetical protein
MAESPAGPVTISPLAGKPAGWFASGTESIGKIHADPFGGQAHLDTIVAEARAIVDHAMGFSA